MQNDTEGGLAFRAGTLLPATLPRPHAAKLVIRADAPRLDQIRAVGCDLLFQYGYSGMTMRQIAARLAIKAASIYYHFPSKQDILFDLMRRTATDLLEGLRRITQSGKGPAAQFEDAVRWHVLFHTQKREEAFVSHSELRSLEPDNLEAILKLREEYDRMFDSILKEGHRQGIFQAQPNGVVRNAILTMCTATAGWFSPEGRLSASEVADQMWSLIAAALLPPAAI
ncbi:MAG: TetR/AcrR family transcriptional regulator [Acidobacteria bacterium]|nr:TetR/AcrR family transcriptional regulator [Acidobacteriota bacterium]